jgi:hypothetical protein
LKISIEVVKSPSLKSIKLTLWKKHKNLIVLAENLCVRKGINSEAKKNPSIDGF